MERYHARRRKGSRQTPPIRARCHGQIARGPLPTGIARAIGSGWQALHRNNASQEPSKRLATLSISQERAATSQPVIVWKRCLASTRIVGVVSATRETDTTAMANTTKNRTAASTKKTTVWALRVSSIAPRYQRPTEHSVDHVGVPQIIRTIDEEPAARKFGGSMSLREIWAEVEASLHQP